MRTRKFNLYLLIQLLLVIYTIFFFVVYVVGLDHLSLFKESLDNFLNGVYCLAFSFLPMIVKKLKIEFTKTLAVYFLIAIIGHFIIGGTFGGYKTLYYSFGIHLINSFLMGVVCYGIILRNVKKQGKLFMFLTTLACVALIGMCWELVEYAVDTLFNGNMQKTLDSVTLEPFVGKRAVYDTMNDILMDLLGGVFAGLFSAINFKGKPLYLFFELKSTKYRSSLFGMTEYYFDKKQKNNQSKNIAINNKEEIKSKNQDKN